MLVEIFVLLIRAILQQTGGSLARSELLEELLEELDATQLHDATRPQVDELISQATAGGQLIEVAGDVVDLAAAIDHVGFTHRLSAEEVATDRLDLDADLALISRLAGIDGGLHLPDATPLRHVVEVAPGAGRGGTGLRTTRLAGPPGWLAGHQTGAIVVATVADGTLHLRGLADDEPEPTASLAADLGARLADELRAAAHDDVEGDGAPSGIDDLQAAGLVAGWFEPGPDRPPFGEVLVVAGFELSGGLAASADRWEPFARVELRVGVGARHGDHLDEPEQAALIGVLDALAAWRRDRTSTPSRSALAPLHRMPEAALCLEEELVRADPSGRDLVPFLDAFDRPGGTVAAALDALRALAADLTGRTDDAESLLADARAAAPEWFPATEALAHLHEVRGHTQEAVNLLQTTRTAEDAELQILRLRARLSASSTGRNEPCPCGSGRKYKQCHLGQTLLPPEVQVSWLLDKARTHLNRFGPFSVTDRLSARVDLHADAELMAADVALFGYGCLQGFLDARREVLPADEVALSEAWIADHRPGLYRVVGGDYGDRTSDAIDGETVVLVDIATNEPFVVQGTALFDESGLADVVWCRLLPDGERWWTSGFARGVEPDELDVLAAATAPDVAPADLLRALLGQPVGVTVHTADGHARVVGAASWALGSGDRAAAEAVLDEQAERHGDRWTVEDEHGPAILLSLLDPLGAAARAVPGVAEPDPDLPGRYVLHARTDSIARHRRAVDLVEAWFPQAGPLDERATPLARHRARRREDELLTALSEVPEPEDDDLDP